MPFQQDDAFAPASPAEQALVDLGLTHHDLRAAGARMLNVGLVYPLDEERVQELAAGLDRVIVVEEKRDFLEQQVPSARRMVETADEPSRVPA